MGSSGKMANKRQLLLHWLNVVILARYHNPSILNPDFLKHNGIVPPDWKVTNQLNTPPLAQIIYENGVIVSIAPDRFDAKQTCNSELKESYLVHDLAARYAAQLPHVGYTGVGLNWLVSIDQAEPKQWLKQRFIKSGNWAAKRFAITTNSIKFEVEAGRATCNLTLSVRSETKDPAEGVIVCDANFDHQDPLSAGEVGEIVRTWSDRQHFLIETLERLTGFELL